MIRRIAGAAVLALGLLVGGTAPALANEVAPGGGDGFGQHVAEMAPEHATMHGADFGACVSAMAQGQPCPHDHHPQDFGQDFYHAGRSWTGRPACPARRDG